MNLQKLSQDCFVDNEDESQFSLKSIQKSQQHNRIMLQDNPELGITFGTCKENQFLNNLFTQTPLFQIHSIKQTKHNPSSSYNNFCLPDHAQSRNPQNQQQRGSRRIIDLCRLRENMSKLTYSIKTIQSKDDQQIGVSTKRVIMGNKALQKEKERLVFIFASKKRFKSSLGLKKDLDLQENEENQCQTQRSHNKQVIPHNKFMTKRLNVIVRKKKRSSFSEKDGNENARIGSAQQFPFQTVNGSAQNCIQQQKELSGINRITFRNTRKEQRSSTLQNKKLNYQNLINRKLQKTKNGSFESSPFMNLHQHSNNIHQQTRFTPNQPILLLPTCPRERQRKLSLSNILSQYHSQLIHTTQISHQNPTQPLRQLLKSKFSTISKPILKQNHQLCYQNSFININLKKNNILRNMKFEGLENDFLVKNDNAERRKFMQYKELQNENQICF